MIYVEAPNPVPLINKKYLFLAGGITNCPDWQAEVKNAFHAHYWIPELVILNPRRDNFKVGDDESTTQIMWEHKAMNMADGIIFWFPKETLCPITLFEYGKWLNTDKKLFVGTDPLYQRNLDIQVQTKLVRKQQYINHSLSEVIKAASAWARYE